MSELIRQAVVTSGMTLTAIAEATGIDRGRLSRFVRQERGLGMEAIDALAAHFGFRLVKQRKKGR